MDVRVENHGTLFLFRLLTPSASAFVEHHVDASAQMIGNALIVEHRYARDLAVGMMEHGLEVG